MEKYSLVDVVLNSRVAGNEGRYTYLNSGNAKIGEAYSISLGVRQAIGYVVRCYEATPNQLSFDASLLKKLGTKVEKFDLPLLSLKLASWITKEYLVTLSESFDLFVPPGLQGRLKEEWFLCKDIKNEALSTVQKEILDLFKLETCWSPPKDMQSTHPILRTLKKMNQNGWVEKRLILKGGQEKNIQEETYTLTHDHESVEKFLKTYAKKKPAQAYTLMRLQGSEKVAFSLKELRMLTQATPQSLKSLIQSNLLVPYSKNSLNTSDLPILNSAQDQAINIISDAIKKSELKTFLLYGITGSGKTEVYLHAAAEVMKKGKRVLYLVPEIALTAQVVAKLKDRFGPTVGVLHSNLNPYERLETWFKIRQGEYAILLGARSAAFAPLENIGLIVIDEEHETSYKQESNPRYNIHSVVQEISKYHGSVVVLGSATPSFETFYATEQKQIERLNLPQRAVAASLPKVILEDLTDLYKNKQAALLSPLLHKKIIETLDRKEQIILFLNRRAYSPSMMCRDCGYTYVCKECTVTLSYHRSKSLLKCHHCGYQQPVKPECESCGSTKVSPFGIGIEKVEEFIQSQFPSANIARLDRDVAQRKNALPEILSRFRGGEIDILVGTQILAKGLDFPNVTLVGVIAADLSLHFPDFRASERTFQLLTQVAGRAGRGKKPGTVIIQTFHKDNFAIKMAESHDFQNFYIEALKDRELAGYPPFTYLINIIFSGKDYIKVSQVAENFKKQITISEQIKVLGPVDCPLSKIQGLWRKHILLKFSLKAARSEWIRKLCFPKGDVSVIIDVDPINML